MVVIGRQPLIKMASGSPNFARLLLAIHINNHKQDNEENESIHFLNVFYINVIACLYIRGEKEVDISDNVNYETEKVDGFVLQIHFLI